MVVSAVTVTFLWGGWNARRGAGAMYGGVITWGGNAITGSTGAITTGAWRGMIGSIGSSEYTWEIKR